MRFALRCAIDMIEGYRFISNISRDRGVKRLSRSGGGATWLERVAVAGGLWSEDGREGRPGEPNLQRDHAVSRTVARWVLERPRRKRFHGAARTE